MQKENFYALIVIISLLLMFFIAGFKIKFDNNELEKCNKINNCDKYICKANITRNANYYQTYETCLIKEIGKAEILLNCGDQ